MADQAKITTFFNADITGLKARIQQAGGEADSLKTKFGAVGKAIVGAFAVTAIKSFISNLLSTADAVDNASKRMQVSAETVQSLGVMAKEAGLEMGDFERSILKLTRASAEAQTGNKSLISAFSALGVSVGELQSLSPEQLFDRVSKALQEGGTSAAETAAAYDVLGKGGGKLLEVIKEVAGAGGLEAVNKNMLEMGRISSNEAIKGLDDIELSLARAGQKLKSFSMGLLAAIAHLTGLAKVPKVDLITEEEAKAQVAAFAEANRLRKEQEQVEAAIKAAQAEQAEITKELEANARGIAEQDERRAAALQKQNEALDKQITDYMDEAMSLEQQLFELQRDRAYNNADAAGKQIMLQNELGILQSNLNDAMQQYGADSNEVLKIKIELEKKEIEIEQLLKGQARLAGDVAGTWRDMSSEQADTLVKLRDALADMSDTEIDEFLAKLAKLATTLTKDPAFQGKLPPMLAELGNLLESISGFKIPQMTSGQMGQLGIGGALSSFIASLKITPEDMKIIQQLGALGLDKILDPISKFKVPNFPPGMGSQLGKALANLIAGIGPLPAGGLDLSFLQNIADFKLPKNFTEDQATKFANAMKSILAAFSGANTGAITALTALFTAAGPGGELKITVEGGENLPESIPITWPTESLALTNSGLATEATLAAIQTKIDSIEGIKWA